MGRGPPSDYKLPPAPRAWATFGQELLTALRDRGWSPTAWESSGRHSIIVGFDFMPQRKPSWLKAFQVAVFPSDSPQAVLARVEDAAETWKAGVRLRLEAHTGTTPTLRRMLAEHGPLAVEAAMARRLVA